MLFSFWRYLHFCPDFLVMFKNVLIGKTPLISKFMTSQTGQQIRHITQYLKKQKQSGDEIWAVNKI